MNPETQESVEQTDTQESGDERDALIKAAENAAENDIVDDSPANDTKPKDEKAVERAQKEKKPKEEEEEKAPLSELAAVLRGREKAQRMRDEADSVRQQANQAKAEAEQARAEYQKLLSEVKAERQKLENLKRNPLQAIREIGWDTEDLVQNVIREGTPEWQAMSKQERVIESQKQEVSELKSMIQQLSESLTQRKQAEEESFEQMRRQQTLTTFMSEHASEEKCPNLHTLYDSEEIIARGDQIADEYRKRTGQVASLSEIAEYLELKAAERVAEMRQKLGARTNTTNRVNGPRTLSASQASERRASPKPIREMSQEEERDALIAAYKDATRSVA